MNITSTYEKTKYEEIFNKYTLYVEESNKKRKSSLKLSKLNELLKEKVSFSNNFKVLSFKEWMDEEILKLEENLKFGKGLSIIIGCMVLGLFAFPIYSYMLKPGPILITILLILCFITPFIFIIGMRRELKEELDLYKRIKENLK